MVDKKTVEYVAHLARIAISEEEKQSLVPQLSKILEYIDVLKKVDIDSVEPMSSLLTENNILRPDEATKKDFWRDILRNAPSCENNHFKIPKVIE